MRYVSTARAGELLREGKVGLIPTETVVGLVAGEAGFSRLFEIKNRDPDQHIALLCGTTEEALALPLKVPPLARVLASRFWPGPLTLVLEAQSGGTVGLRVPAHPIARALLASHKGPLYATSANLSGEPAPMSVGDVDPRVYAAVDLIIEGESGSGEASAVVDLSGDQVRLLRPSRELSGDELLRLKG